MSQDSLDCLRAAIARNSAAVLSLPTSGLLHHRKTRLLAEDAEGFWIESIPDQTALIDDLMKRSVPVGMAFKAGNMKTVFTAPILRREPQYAINKFLAVEALLIAYPQNIRTVQRRSTYRTSIPSSCELVVRVWKIPEHWILRDKPAASLEIQAKARDLSVGGIGLLCAPRGEKPVEIAADARLRVQILFNKEDVILEGRARHTRLTPDNSLRLGVQFKKLDDDLEGRHTLARLNAIVGELHREELRRLRMGLAS